MATEKRVAIDIDVDPRSGEVKLLCDWSGFVGNECFREADKLKGALAAVGLEVEIIRVEPKKDEVEVRKLENQARVGL